MKKRVLSVVCALGKKKNSNSASALASKPAVATPQVIENRQEIIAAVSAVVAEELGTDISAIRILSFKKI